VTYKPNPGQQRALELFCSGKRFNLVYGGSRSGKTFKILNVIVNRGLAAPGSRHLVVRQEGTAAKRAIVKDTFPKMMAICYPGVPYEWFEQYGFFRVQTSGGGFEIWVGGLNDDKALEKILGAEYATVFINEASEVRYNAFTLLRSRLAQSVPMIGGGQLSQRFYVDLNPTTRQHWTYRLWIDGVDPETQAAVDPDAYGHVVVNPMDNAANLSAEYLTDLRSLPDRARKRFLEGKYVEDVEDALWRRSMIKRVSTLPPLRRIVVAVDPAVTNEPGSDETGIVAVGADAAGNAYVLDDASGKYSPHEWARMALAVYDGTQADRIVAEVNQGGDMVEHTIRAMRSSVPFRGVRASRGKVTRAEPIAALYERGKVYHAGEFPELEDQMCSMTTGFNAKATGWSPDRVDALVWALSDLFPDVAKPRDDDDEHDYDDARGFNETTGY
jgi:predicted phage terminase large subunit-like protein